MRFPSLFCVVFIFRVAATPVRGQPDPLATLATLPICAQTCLFSSFANSICDPIKDISCRCNNRTQQSTAINCFSTSCTARETLFTLNITTTMCEVPVRDRSTMLRVVNAVFFTLSDMAILGRFFSHVALRRLQPLDDGNMALILVLTYKAFTGLGQDMWKVSFYNIRLTLLCFWIGVPFYGIELGLIKIAFGLFYLRIFDDLGFRKLVWFAIGFTITYTIVFAILGTFVCVPVSYFWWQWDLGGVHKGKCLNNNTIGFVSAAFSICTDFAMLGLPITQVWNLHLSMKKKLRVLFMFSVGFLLTIVSIIRLRSLIHFAKTANMTSDEFLDTVLWSLIEVYVGIICVCMPSLSLGIQRLSPKILHSIQMSITKKTSPNQSGGSIAVRTSFAMGYSTRPQTDELGSVVELVEVAGDARSVEIHEDAYRNV
ncbi:hypothetical protein DM02DRAFT_526672 [Periconia macrospinosa]|uniref:CFEM domain-containing protein n=1 Tax=Periconia macrospinosa TaxID=97972 RepID=A0A2V1DTK2_9PLEO|nr:hypothetical protein DM02DRAFT_526672 [Periconia macrospinosa]